MTAERIEHAVKRIETAMQRIDAARDAALGVGNADSAGGNGSARVIELVNIHEKLREQVAETLRELDGILTKLEDQ